MLNFFKGMNSVKGILVIFWAHLSIVFRALKIRAPLQSITKYVFVKKWKAAAILSICQSSVLENWRLWNKPLGMYIQKNGRHTSHHGWITIVGGMLWKLDIASDLATICKWQLSHFSGETKNRFISIWNSY